jgi:hypothetical protein
VLSVVAPFVAIPLAHVVIRRLQHDGGRGLGIAQVAIVIGYLTLLVIGLVVLNLVVALFLTHG